MIEAKAPRYTAVPCRGIGSCSANVDQSCTGVLSMGSHRCRRQLWVALHDAQAKGQSHVQWYGWDIRVRSYL